MENNKQYMKKLKYLKTFESLNELDPYGEENEDGEQNLLKMSSTVVDEYCSKYPEHSTFFKEFINVYPNEKDFKNDLLDEIQIPDDEEEDDEFLDDEYVLDNYWTPEDEVYMLEMRIGNYPGDAIWPDFYNDLIASDWH